MNNNRKSIDFFFIFRCAQDKIRKDEHDRSLDRNRQEEELKAAQHKRDMEAGQQRHKQELEQKEHQKELELKEKEKQKELELQERAQAEHLKQDNLRFERMQVETERECQHKRELQMEGIKVKGKVAEAEARKAEAKAKEADAVARAAEAKVRFAEAEARVKTAKAKEREVELRSMLWKRYFDPEMKLQDKQLIMEEIKRLTISSSEDQNVKKVPGVVANCKEINAPKSKGDLVEAHPRRPWTTSRLPRSYQ